MTVENNGKSAIGIIGSPRRKGNTDIIVNEVLKGANEAGANTESVFLGKLKINPCLGCEVCKKKHRCVHEDDMPGLAQKILKSQICVLGTPVYFWGPTAQFKTFFDRFYWERYVIKGKKIIIVIPFEDKDPEMASLLVRMITDAIKYIKGEVIDIILAPGVYKKGDVRKYDELLLKARKAGYDAVLNSV